MKRYLLSVLLVAVGQAACAQTPPDEHASHHSTEQATAVDTHENMKAMRALMDKLNHTKDPAERAKLLTEHRELMKKQMQAMQSMQSMQAGGGMNCSSEMMQGRMGMMKDMMDQMMRHEDAEHAAH